MVLIFKNEYADLNHEELCKLSKKNIVYISPYDFYKSSWQIYFHDFQNSYIIQNENRYLFSDFTLVINLINQVVEEEFYFLDNGDRSYACREAMSLLYFMIDNLDSPVINRISLDKKSVTSYIYEKFLLKLFDFDILSKVKINCLPKSNIEIIYYNNKIYCDFEVSFIDNILNFFKNLNQIFSVLQFYVGENGTLNFTNVSFCPDLSNSKHIEIIMKK